MYFKFNGRDSKQWGYDLTSSLIIEKLDNIEGEELKVSEKYKEKFIRIKKVNKITGEIVKFSKLEIDTINSWLFEEDYKCLEVGLYCYNAIFKRRKFMWTENNGYIDLIVRLYNNALSSKMIDQVVVNRGEKTININNKSNIRGLKLETELGVKLKDENVTKVIIENITSGKITKFEGLEMFDNIYVNSKNEYIKSNDKNIYSKFNGTYLTLLEGINEIKISSNGFTKIIICYRQEFNLEEVWLNE